MIGRRTVIGVLLLCAAGLFIVGVPSALANGTTAFTCAEVAEGDFTDAHCTFGTTPGTGKFGHIGIEVGKTTEITFSNEKTGSETTSAEPSLLAGELFGAALEIECKKVTGTGTLKNEEEGGGAMQTTGDMLIEHSECTVPKPKGCALKAPIVYDSHFTTTSEMALKFTPRVGTTFGSFTLVNNGAESCALKATVGISGSFEGVATAGAVLTLKARGSQLRWSSSTYDLDGAITLRMKEGNPIAFTT